MYPSLYCSNVIFNVKSNTFHSEHVGLKWDLTLVLYDFVLGLKYIYLVRISLIGNTINREVRLEGEYSFDFLQTCNRASTLNVIQTDLIYFCVQHFDLTLRFTSHIHYYYDRFDPIVSTLTLYNPIA